MTFIVFVLALIGFVHIVSVLMTSGNQIVVVGGGRGGSGSGVRSSKLPTGPQSGGGHRAHRNSPRRRQSAQLERTRGRRSRDARSGKSSTSSRQTSTSNEPTRVCNVRLSRLNVDERISFVSSVPEVVVPHSAWRLIVSGSVEPGCPDSFQMSVVPFVTVMQWKSGIYGTVGQLNGVGLGRLTSLLAHAVDVDAGERLFVADEFPTSGSGSTRRPACGSSTLLSIDVHEAFQANVRLTTAFDRRAADAARQLVVYRGQPADLRSLGSTSWLSDLAQFRLMVVSSGSESSGSLLDNLDTAVCLLRDGGLIVVDVTESNVDDGSRSDGPTIVDRFLAASQPSVNIVPILSAGNKLYLTTTNFRRKYTDYIRDAGDWLEVHLGLLPTKTVGHGGFEYLHLTNVS